MARKPPSIEHVKWVERNGKYYGYFNTGKKVNGQPVRKPLPPYSSPSFWPSYGTLKGNRDKRASVGYTVADLLRDYQRSPRFERLAANTQRSYLSVILKIDAVWGKFPVNQLTPAYVRKGLDGEGWPGQTQNLVVGVLGAIYTWGRRSDKAAIWPTKDIERIPGGEHEPWPDDILAKGLAAENDTVRLLVHLLCFTGLRINDALALRWGQIEGGVITVTPQKTARFKKTLYIPLLSELERELARTPRKGLRIVEGIEYRRARDLLQNFTASHGVKTVPHGLRKNAVNALLLAGCTVAEVQAITGQTYQVIEHYARRVSGRKLADAAIVKLEAYRKKIPNTA